jgi:hypothetical protein
MQAAHGGLHLALSGDVLGTDEVGVEGIMAKKTGSKWACNKCGRLMNTSNRIGRLRLCSQCEKSSRYFIAKMLLACANDHSKPEFSPSSRAYGEGWRSGYYRKGDNKYNGSLAITWLEGYIQGRKAIKIFRARWSPAGR